MLSMPVRTGLNDRKCADGGERQHRHQWRRRRTCQDRRRQELWLNLGDGVNQAANLISGVTSIPSLNFTPLMTFGN